MLKTLAMGNLHPPIYHKSAPTGQEAEIDKASTAVFDQDLLAAASKNRQGLSAKEAEQIEATLRTYNAILQDFYASGGNPALIRWRPLGAFEPDVARSLLHAEQTGGWSRPLDDGLVERAVTWCGGHPLKGE